MPGQPAIETVEVAVAHEAKQPKRQLTCRGDRRLNTAERLDEALPVAAFGLIMGRRSLSGSPIGGIAETQEMLDFCGKHNITADVEVIPIQKVNEAYERLLKSDVKYRFSIDMASIRD